MQNRVSFSKKINFQFPLPNLSQIQQESFSFLENLFLKIGYGFCFFGIIHNFIHEFSWILAGLKNSSTTFWIKNLKYKYAQKFHHSFADNAYWD